ncbi:c-type cytochrome [Psychroserpens luteus]|uniref:C-type cytochrome n=1 Tax=Psychroserpens luteus TaxID=1434066 RepID=A0ABW5ZVB0_9FLAO
MRNKCFYYRNSFRRKKLFNANCASCHKLDKNMAGPALRGIA